MCSLLSINLFLWETSLVDYLKNTMRVREILADRKTIECVVIVVVVIIISFILKMYHRLHETNYLSMSWRHQRVECIYLFVCLFFVKATQHEKETTRTSFSLTKNFETLAHVRHQITILFLSSVQQMDPMIDEEFQWRERIWDKRKVIVIFPFLFSKPKRKKKDIIHW